MNSTFLLGATLGMIGALSINLGKGVQKLKVHVLREGWGMFSATHRRDLSIWLFGLLLTSIAAVPISLGMKLTESPSTIGAMTGVGLVGLVFFASRVVGEPISRRDALGIVLVVLGTSVLGYMGGLQPKVARSFEPLALARSLAIPLAVGAGGCVVARFLPRLGAVAWGLLGGVCLGSAFFLADAALVHAKGDLIGQLATPYPYIALTVGTGALVATQIGFLRGRALEVVPAVNSAAIVTPIALEFLLYGRVPRPLTAAVIALIVVGVYLLSTGTAAKVSK